MQVETEMRSNYRQWWTAASRKDRQLTASEETQDGGNNICILDESWLGEVYRHALRRQQGGLVRGRSVLLPVIIVARPFCRLKLHHQLLFLPRTSPVVKVDGRV